MLKSKSVRNIITSLILLLAVSCGALFFHLGSLPLSGADEPRYARIAQEMYEQRNWVTPMLEGKPWLEKPPLYYWITAPFYSFVNSHETSARLGPALCALATAIGLFWLGSVLWSRTAGMLGALILLTSIGIIGYGRSASTDMPFTCFLTLSMAVFAAALKKQLGWKILSGYVFLGIAVLGKGPVALILAAGIAACVWVLDESGSALRRWRVLSGLPVAAIVSIPWFWLVFRENGFSFISTFFINHNIARYITNVHHHSQPFWYYLPVILGLLFPWSGWLAVLIKKSPAEAFRRWREWDSAMIFLTCWFVVPIVFFSISDSKLAGYVLPSIPPLALILAIRLVRAAEKEDASKPLRAGAALHLVFSIVVAIAAPVMFLKEYADGRTGFIISAAVLLPAVLASALAYARKWKPAFAATALQGLLLVAVLAQFAFPALGAYHSTREIAQRALAVSNQGEPVVTFRYFHHSLHYYTGYRVAGKIEDENSLAEFARVHPRFLVVTKADGLKQISGMKELAATLLYEQGKLRLVQVHRRP